MSFLLPTVDFEGAKGCFLESNAPTPELLASMGYGDPNMPIYALWGGSTRCVDLLLTAIADEAANRSLTTFACRSPASPHLRSALWVEGVGLLQAVDTILPSRCRLIDLSPLSSGSTDERETRLATLKMQESVLAKQCTLLGSSSAKLTETSLALTADYHDVEKLAQKAARIAAAQPTCVGGARVLPISVITAKGERLRMLPFGEEVQIVGLSELYGVAAHFLALLTGALDERSGEYVRLVERWSGAVVGVWLTASKRCYLIDPPDRRQKLMTLSRYLLPRPQDIRERYRALERCRGEIERQIAYFVGEIDGIRAQIGEIEARTLQKSRLGEFRKRLLIELFCR